jgi:hypothetical protein
MVESDSSNAVAFRAEGTAASPILESLLFEGGGNRNAYPWVTSRRGAQSQLAGEMPVRDTRLIAGHLAITTMAAA